MTQDKFLLFHAAIATCLCTLGELMKNVVGLLGWMWLGIWAPLAFGAWPSPPLEERFSTVALPTNAYWSFTSSVPGRVQVVGNSNVNARTSSVPASISKLASVSASNTFVGDVFVCTNDTFLTRQQIYLDILSASKIPVTFFVYESKTSNGTYSLIHTNVVLYEATDTNIVSDYSSVGLEAGTFYFVGAHWTSESTFAYTNAAAQSVGFGRFLRGYAKDKTASPPGSLTNIFSGANNVYAQKLTTTDEGVLRMDGSSTNAAYTNQAVLRMNLTNANPLLLSFRFRSSSDEAGADGVYLSTNGSSYQRIVEINVGSTTRWVSVQTDLVAAAMARGIALTTQSWIKFQQADNYPWPEDGLEFDDIVVAPRLEPDLDLQSLSWTSPLYIRGTNNAIVFNLAPSVAGYGGLTNINATITNRYELHSGLGSNLVHFVDSGFIYNLPAGSSFTQTLSDVMSLPFGTKLTNVIYSLGATSNRGFAFAESDTSNNVATNAHVLNHYSGNLYFGNVRADFYMTNCFMGLPPFFNPTNHLVFGTGTVAGYSFTATNLMVEKNLSTLDYHVHPSNLTVITLPVFQTQIVQNVAYNYAGGVHLSQAGARANVRMRLPAGLGHAATSNAMLLSPYLSFTNAPLSQNLFPLAYTNNQLLYFCEETKPLMIPSVQTVWRAAAGSIELDSGGNTPVYVRSPHLRHLEANAALLVKPQWATKKSNERYYDFINKVVTNAIIYSTAPRRDARMDVQFSFKAGTNIAHFPYGVSIPFQFGGEMRVVKDLPETVDDKPFLGKVGATLLTQYARDVATESCAGSAGLGQVALPIGNLPFRLTADGGFLLAGALTPANIQWGTRHDGVFAHGTEPFAEGSFYMPGHFQRYDRRYLATVSNLAPAEILLNGLMTNNASTLERQGTTNYLNGFGDYAGLNLRVGSDEAVYGESALGGEPTGPYPLTGRSKYYLRRSGVSGIHEATELLDEKFTIYGYSVTFTNFGLSFLSLTNIDSRTCGQISLPPPSGFDVAFERMLFTPLGDLDNADVPTNVGQKVLTYWQSRITPLDILFVEDASAPCGSSNRFLTLPVETACANVDARLFGTLGFQPDGNLVTAARAIDGIDSRLSLPGSLSLAGPSNDVYSFKPVALAYLNNFDAETNQSTGVGFINLVGSLDVPFFEDMPVHLQTSANTNSVGASVFFMGGWPTLGWTNAAGQSFFDLSSFDSNNDAYPTNRVAGNGAYRSGSNYRPRATRHWLGLVPFDYPLEWSTSTKSFKSPAAETIELLVLDVEHQVDYLGAKRAELSFGAQYDGLPQINLANMAFNAVNEQTGIASCFVSNGISAVADAIVDGTDELNLLVDAQLRDLVDDVMSDLIDPVVSNLYGQLYSAYTNDPAGNYFTNAVNQYVAGIGAGGTDTAAKKLGQIAASGSNLVARVDQSLAEVETMLDAFIGSVPSSGGRRGPDVDGLLTLTDGQYEVLAGIGQELVRQLASEAADAIGADLDPGLADALREVSSTLEQIRLTMVDLRNVVSDLRARLAAGQDFALELSSKVDPLVVSNLTLEAATQINARFATWQADNLQFTAHTPDEIREMIRTEIEKAFYASVLAEQLQTTIRSRIYELSSSIQQAADGVFQQLNDAIRAMLSDLMQELDEEINGALGSLGDSIGAGQLNGYAHISGDSLEELRIDGKFQWKVPDALEFNGYMIIRQLDSDGANGCSFEGGTANEVVLGADDVSLNWISEGLKADVSTKFTFAANPVEIVGMAGAFEMTGGTLGFESFKVTQLAAAVAFGSLENYISAAVGAQFDSFEVMGGIFLGKTCDIAPLELWDPDVVEVLGSPPFTGIYSYGEGWMPIYDYGCVFNISAGAGAGIFYFVDGPIGGKIMLGAKGEALCAVTIRGEVRVAGSKNGGNFTLVGKGKLSGKAGCCPFCVKFKKQVKLTYKNGSWDADY